jgi:hypothetical protein
LAFSNDIGFAERAAQALQKHQELFPMVEKFLEEASLLRHEGSAWATRLQEWRYRSAVFIGIFLGIRRPDTSQITYSG